MAHDGAEIVRVATMTIRDALAVRVKKALRELGCPVALSADVHHKDQVIASQAKVGVPQEQALDVLIELMKEDDAWHDLPEGTSIIPISVNSRPRFLQIQ